MRNYGALVFGNSEFVHEEFNTFGDFGTDEAFFEIGDGTVVTTDDFIFGGATDGFVVGDAFTDNVDAHVSRGIINVATGDAVEDFFEYGEDVEIAIVIDDLFAVMFEMEMVNHVDIAEVGSSGFVGDIDWMFQR